MNTSLCLLALLFPADDLAGLRARAGKGEAEAMFELGLRYHKGQGVEKDDKVALEWHRKAAAKDHTKAEVQIGYLIAHGFGAKQDFAEAAKWYRKAAGKGDTTALHNMGLQALHGHGMKKDPEQAVRWLLLAAQQGHARASFNLGELHEQGNGVEKDRVLACTLYTLAADRTDAERERLFGKPKAEEVVKQRDRLRAGLSEEECKRVDASVASWKALVGVHPRKFGQPGGVGQIRGWYLWEKWDPQTGMAEVRNEAKGVKYSVRVLPWATTYRRLVYGDSPNDLLRGERVNLFFAPDERHERGFLVHFQDEIGQMKGHGHSWQVLSSDEKANWFTARVMAGDKPLDGREHAFEVDPRCTHWVKGKSVGSARPEKGAKLYLTWVQDGPKKVVKLMSDEASLEAVRAEEQVRIDRRVAKEGLAGETVVVEDDLASVLLFATSWQQAARLKEGQRVKLAVGGVEVSGRVISRKNRGAYGSGPSDIVLQFEKADDAGAIRKLAPGSPVRLIP